MPRSYDLAVAYRIYAKVAKPALAFSNDKLHLAECCLRSFCDSLGGLQVKVWALLDGCPVEYEDLFLKYFDPRDLILLRSDEIGNLATFGRQIDILLEQRDAELVYFAEDDYIYLPGQFRRLIDVLVAHNDVDFVTPYDHPDCYRLALHQRPKWIRIHADHHWRNAASTCLTFLTMRDTLRKTESTFRSYQRGNRDASLWLSLSKEGVWNPAKLAHYAIRDEWLAKIFIKAWLHGWSQILFGRRYRLWAPLPGIATHLDANGLSPAIDWKSLIHQYESPELTQSPPTQTALGQR